MSASPWVCPVCRQPLDRTNDPPRLSCAAGHSYDVARQGYVNLLIAGQRRSREPGDSAEMVRARRRFLATGAYDRVSDAVAHVVARAAAGIHERYGGGVTLLDVGCADGHHTRRIAENVTSGASGLDPLPTRVCGIDVAKPAISLAARADRTGWYAVSSAADLPVTTAGVDVATNIFGPVVPHEMGRAIRPGGSAVVAHPGRDHLGALRSLVYGRGHPHEIKDPLRNGSEWLTRVGNVTVTFPIVIDEAAVLIDLFTMTPYRWHARPDIFERLEREAGRPGGFVTEGDVVITSYVRRDAGVGAWRG